MKNGMKTLAAALMLAGLAGVASAQEAESADELLSHAGNVLRQLDAGNYGDLWDGAAAFIKAGVPREQFAANTRLSREGVGQVARRSWSSVVRIRYDNTNNGTNAIPSGRYANVDFTTELANGRTVFELVSFRLENDGHWHLTGYVPRQHQGKAPNVAKGAGQ